MRLHLDQRKRSPSHRQGVPDQDPRDLPSEIQQAAKVVLATESEIQRAVSIHDVR